MYEEFPVEIQDTLKTLDGLKVRIINMLPHFVVAKEIKKRFKDLDISLKIDWWGDLQIHVIFVEHIKQIVPLLRWIARKGYKQSFERMDSPRTNVLTYSYDDFEVVIHLAKEGESCKFVITGVTTEEKPIYELQCN